MAFFITGEQNMSKENFNSKMEEMKNKLFKIKKEYKDATKKLVTESWEIFEDGSKEIFEKNKNLESFGWIQYTPVFDEESGELETTGFAAYVDEPSINDMNIYEVYETDKQLGKAADDVIDFLTIFHDEILQKMFGDNVSLRVTAEGVEKQEYALSEDEEMSGIFEPENEEDFWKDEEDEDDRDDE